MKLNEKGLVEVVYFPGDGTYVEYALPSVGAAEALKYGGSAYVLKETLEAELKRRQQEEADAAIKAAADARAAQIAAEKAAADEAAAKAAQEQEARRAQDEASAAAARESGVKRGRVAETPAAPADVDPLA